MAERELDHRNTELGEHIKMIRESKGLSQTELAYKIGKDQPSLNRVEKGKLSPTYGYLLEIADGLDVHISELIPKK